MLQILIWGVCALIFGVGYCGMMLEKLTAGNKVKSTTGVAIFVLMVIFAGAIFYLSLQQAQG
jgi:hypothetical protein